MMPPSHRLAPYPALRLPQALLGELFPTPQLLAGRLAASTVAMYTRDVMAYVANCAHPAVKVKRADVGGEHAV